MRHVYWAMALCAAAGALLGFWGVEMAGGTFHWEALAGGAVMIVASLGCAELVTLPDDGGDA